MVKIAKRPKSVLNKNAAVIVKVNTSKSGGEDEVQGKLQKKLKSGIIKKGVQKASEKEKKKIANAYKLTETVGNTSPYVKKVKNPVGSVSIKVSKEVTGNKQKKQHSKNVLNNDAAFILKVNSPKSDGEDKAQGKLQKEVKSKRVKNKVKKTSEKEKKKVADAYKLTETEGNTSPYVKKVKNLAGNVSIKVFKEVTGNKQKKQKTEKKTTRRGKKKEGEEEVEEESTLDENLEKECKKTARNRRGKRPEGGRKRKNNRKRINLPSNLRTQIQNGVSALLKLEPENKNDLLGGSGKPILFQLQCFRVPQTPMRHLRFELPHPLRTSFSDVCLFVADLVTGKKHDHEPTVEHVRNLLMEKGGTGLINEIIPLRQLKVEYDQYELKRSLCNRFDFFLSEAKVSGHILHYLGKEFYKKNKIPVPVDLKAQDLNKEISKALSKTALTVHGKGCSFIVTVAHTAQTPEEIENNVFAAAESIARQFPGGWKNIQSLRIKTALSLAIPVYVILKSPNDVPVPYVKPRRPKAAVPVTDELSTIPGARVTVYPSGNVVIEGIEESDEEWKQPALRRYIGSNNEDEYMIFSEDDEDADEEKVPKKRKWWKEYEEEEKEKRNKKREMKGKKPGRATNEATHVSEDESSHDVKMDEASVKGQDADIDDDDDYKDALKAHEEAYLSSWVNLKGDEVEKEKKKSAKKGQPKQSGNSKKAFKKKGQVKSLGKVQKKPVKKKMKMRVHS